MSVEFYRQKIYDVFPQDIKPSIDFEIQYEFDVLKTNVHDNKEYTRLKHNKPRRKIRLRFNKRKNQDINKIWNFYKKMEGKKTFLFILPFKEQLTKTSEKYPLWTDPFPAVYLSWKNRFDINNDWNNGTGQNFNYLSGEIAFEIPYKNYDSFLVIYKNNYYYPLSDVIWKNKYNVNDTWANSLDTTKGWYFYLTPDQTIRNRYYILYQGNDETDYFIFYNFDRKYDDFIYYEAINPTPVIKARFESNNISKTIFENMITTIGISLIEVF